MQFYYFCILDKIDDGLESSLSDVISVFSTPTPSVWTVDTVPGVLNTAHTSAQPDPPPPPAYKYDVSTKYLNL